MTKKPDEDKHDNNMIQIYLSEYGAMRAEIELYLKDTSQYEQFSVALFGGTIASIAACVNGTYPANCIPVALSAALLFVVLQYMSVRKHFAIFRVATYIDTILRPNLSKILSRELMEWEDFKVTMPLQRENPRPVWLAQALKIGILKSIRSNIVYVFPVGVCIIFSIFSIGDPSLFAFKITPGQRALWIFWILCDTLIALIAQGYSSWRDPNALHRERHRSKRANLST